MGLLRAPAVAHRRATGDYRPAGAEHLRQALSQPPELLPAVEHSGAGTQCAIDRAGSDWVNSQFSVLSFNIKLRTY